MSECSSAGGSGRLEYKKVPSLPLLSFKLSVHVKERDGEVNLMTKAAKWRSGKKNNQKLNKTSNESIASQTVSEEDDDSSQEKESSNSTIKRKPDTISPPENQPKSKIANCATTPKTISNEPNTSSNDSSDTSSNTTESSDTSKDSHGLQIDESKLNSRIDTDDNSEGDETNVIKKLLYDISGSDHQRADNSHMQITHGEENMA